MKRALFNPMVTLDDDGTLDVDFADCYLMTVNENGDQVDDDDFGGALDKVLGFVDGEPPPDAVVMLRNLADAIEKQKEPT